MSPRRPRTQATTVPVTFALGLLLGALGLPVTLAQTPARTKATPAPKAAAATKTDLNTATAEDLVANLPGVGPVTARKIIEGRPFAKVEDLERVGVPVRVIENLRPLVTLSAPAADAPKAAPTAAAPATKAMEKAKATPRAAAPAATGPIDVNTATAEQLQELPGVGPVAAQAIIAARPFKSVDDLERVRGLGAAKINALRGRASVGGSTSPAATKAMTKSSPVPARLAPGQVVNINTAPKEVLDLLPGIGPVKAQAIIEGRPFKAKEDIMKVKGIKEGEFSKIKDMITVN